MEAGMKSHYIYLVSYINFCYSGFVIPGTPDLIIGVFPRLFNSGTCIQRKKEKQKNRYLTKSNGLLYITPVCFLHVLHEKYGCYCDSYKIQEFS